MNDVKIIMLWVSVCRVECVCVVVLFMIYVLVVGDYFMISYHFIDFSSLLIFFHVGSSYISHHF